MQQPAANSGSTKGAGMIGMLFATHYMILTLLKLLQWYNIGQRGLENKCELLLCNLQLQLTWTVMLTTTTTTGQSELYYRKVLFFAS